MKLSYQARVKEPFILSLSTEELGSFRFHLHEAVEKLNTKLNNFKALYKIDERYGKVIKSTERDLRELRKVVNRFEKLVMTLKIA